MKKIILSVILLSLFFMPVMANAQGLVPCGNSPDGSDACTINDFFIMLGRIFNFVLTWIVTPLATLMLIIGGLMILASAGNPGLAGKGKQTLIWAIVGMALAFGAWIIINFILGALGYTGAWNIL